MNLKKTLVIAWNDILISVFGNKQANLFSLLLMPIGFAYLTGMLIGGAFSGDPNTEITIDVFDNDTSAQSMQFLDTLRTMNPNLILCPMDAYTGEDESKDRCDLDEDSELTLEASQERFNDGKITGIIEIPAGFGEGVLNGEPTAVTLRYEVDWTKPNYLQQTVQAAVGQVGGASIAAQVGEQVFAQNFDFATDKDVSQFRAAVYDNATAYLANPPAVVSFGETLEDDGFEASGFAQSVPGQGSFFVIMTLLAGVALLVQERDNWTLQRQLTMPVRRAELLGGKIIGRFAMGVFQFGMIFIAGALFGMSYDGIILPVILVLLAFVLCITALTFFLGTILNIRTEQQSQGLTWLVAIPLAGLGGAWFPLDIVPEFMRIIGHLSPVAWMMDGYHDLFFNNGGLEDVIVPVLVLLAMSVVLFIVGIPRFKYE
jgi:ABC-2 type transport system permease protein